LSTPDYSTLCRRQGTVEVALPRRLPEGAVHVVGDATGLKVFGEGEWKVRQHGYSYRRTWRKLHLAVDETSHEVLGAALTTNDVGDNEMLPELLSAFDGPIEQVSADGSYDTWENHHHLQQRGALAAIPPRRTARIRQHGNSRHPPLPRDEALRAIRQHACKRLPEILEDPENGLRDATRRLVAALGEELVRLDERVGGSLLLACRCRTGLKSFSVHAITFSTPSTTRLPWRRNLFSSPPMSITVSKQET